MSTFLWNKEKGKTREKEIIATLFYSDAAVFNGRSTAGLFSEIQSS